MADKYRVTAPYVVAKVRDDVRGGFVARGFHRHAVIRADDIDPDNLQHHLDIDFMEPIEDALPAEVEEPAPADPPADDPAAKVDEPPALVEDAPPADPPAEKPARRGKAEG